MLRMAERSAAKPKGAKKARVLLRVVVGDDSLARLCELGNGNVIAPGQLLPYLDRADIESILFDGPPPSCRCPTSAASPVPCAKR